MSASIYYRIVQPNETALSVPQPSRFVDAMVKAFGSYPWKLDTAHLARLRGMSATCDQDVNPYAKIIDMICCEDGSTQTVEVWPEY